MRELGLLCACYYVSSIDWRLKNEKLRTVFDLCEQNDNTVKDVTPFPDQDNIRHDVARCPYQSKLDMSEAYEQKIGRASCRERV